MFFSREESEASPGVGVDEGSPLPNKQDVGLRGRGPNPVRSKKRSDSGIRGRELGVTELVVQEFLKHVVERSPADMDHLFAQIQLSASETGWMILVLQMIP